MFIVIIKKDIFFMNIQKFKKRDLEIIKNKYIQKQNISHKKKKKTKKKLQNENINTNFYSL
ncbi:hypothetical protein PFBG_01321 [Plasmodium falciparum 7G8]|uniref:Uncharacterized protein n=3 Tax=Plasmodium falciparum TaxID=5833 RepID=A0A024XBG6_PLAFC|nr:hypothetical protein PFFVO_01317 [Plasmodium falciparum Vietnam Oak-Knoll (FVO)]ETW62819.1 hypothetical protein PFMC_01339 [Plasmodium falciparum CAMP/Malaysia]EUR75580.1 hypothetical protein PFBG_01321 [Plasmodium falciparum 7G8]